MKRKVVNLLTTSNNSDKNRSDYSTSDGNSDFRWPKFISFSSLIRKVILNDLGDEREYHR